MRDALVGGVEVSADTPAGRGRGGLDGVPRQVRVSGGRLNLGMAQQPADDGVVEKASRL